MTEQAPITPPLTNVPTPVKLRVEDYFLLDEAGAFARYGKTELLDGEVVYMNAQHMPHARVKSRLLIAFSEALNAIGSDLEALAEVSVAVPPYNVPEPDLVITDAPDGAGLVDLQHVRLVVEVSDTTLSNDLVRKAAIYARHGIPEYWVADVKGRVIHQLWSPEDSAYAARREIAFGQPVTSATIAGLAVDTARLA